MEMVIFQTNSNIELTHLCVFRTETLNKHLRLTRTLNWITLAKYRCCLSANIQTHVLQNIQDVDMKPPRIHDFFTLLWEDYFQNDSDEDDDDGYDYNQDDADDDDDDAVKGDVADNAR